MFRTTVACCNLGCINHFDNFVDGMLYAGRRRFENKVIKPEFILANFRASTRAIRNSAKCANYFHALCISNTFRPTFVVLSGLPANCPHRSVFDNGRRAYFNIFTKTTRIESFWIYPKHTVFFLFRFFSRYNDLHFLFGAGFSHSPSRTHGTTHSFRAINSAFASRSSRPRRTCLALWSGRTDWTLLSLATFGAFLACNSSITLLAVATCRPRRTLPSGRAVFPIFSVRASRPRRASRNFINGRKTLNLHTCPVEQVKGKHACGLVKQTGFNFRQIRCIGGT